MRFLKFDIVLTMYSSLGSELTHVSLSIKEIKQLRVILDEVHFIKTINTKQARDAISLNAKRILVQRPISQGNKSGSSC